MRNEHVFTSPLGRTIADYLALKKALGRRFDVETEILAHLDRFLAAQTSGGSVLTMESFAAWCLTFTHLAPTGRRNRMRVVRNLCLYLRRSDPGCFVPDPNGFPTPHVAAPPHIFTEQQIVQLLRTAAKLRPNSASPLCAEVMRLAIVLLYTAGLRRGEIGRLVLSDYDPTERTLLVRASKFHKSRLVTLSQDAAREMDIYLRARRRLPHGTDAPLLVNHHGGLRPYQGSGLWRTLSVLMHRAEIRAVTGRVPRVHDLRHTYAVHVLLRWYRAGVDIQSKLPALATAMGHVSIFSTAHYLRFIDPIAEAASERFARHCEDLIRALPGGGGTR